MKFYAVFKTTVEKHVLLDVDNWQDAARIANTMKKPIVQAGPRLEFVGMCLCESPECNCGHYESVHELVGPCNKCGLQILERSCSPVCVEMHESSDGDYKRGGGWCSTVHGHVTWCSQECRDADRANDPEVEVLDRMVGISDE